jgi:alpha-tubulin suppressor-like RCC1 family protein
MRLGTGTPQGRFVRLTLPMLLAIWGCADFKEAEDQYCERNASTCSRSRETSGDEPDSIRQVSSRMQHTLAIAADGSVWAWGQNTTAQLGDGTTEDRTRPTKLQGLSEMEAVAAGDGYSLALGQRKVWTWGQIGSGERRMTPAEVPGLSDITAIAAGNIHSLARHQSGSVLFWGVDRTGKQIDTPTVVNGLPRIELIAAGGEHSLVLDEHDEVWAWGDNSQFQLGRDDVAVSDVPVKVLGLPRIKAIAAGYQHSLALDMDNRVWTWGSNEAGQLGDGSIGGRRARPQRIETLTDIRELAAGTHHSLARTGNNELMAWGQDSAGQLGDSLDLKDQPTPVRVQAITSAVSISAGHSHSLAVLNGGCLNAWGSNQDGRLGFPAVSSAIPSPLPILSSCLP